MISLINKTLLIIISIFMTFALAIDDSPFIFENITIEKIKSSKGDKRRIKRLQSSKSSDISDNSIYIIKIQTNLPATSSSCTIYFGDIKIKEYGSYNKGIVIKVYSEEELKTLSGKELSYSLGLDTKRYHSGATAPNTELIKNNKRSYESLPDFYQSFENE